MAPSIGFYKTYFQFTEGHCLNHTAVIFNKYISVMGIFSGIHISFLFEYETPKVIKVKNVPMGILRLVLQTTMILFVVLYQLWYARGYQEFLDVDASVGTKVKGFSM